MSSFFECTFKVTFQRVSSVAERLETFSRSALASIENSGIFLKSLLSLSHTMRTQTKIAKLPKTQRHEKHHRRQQMMCVRDQKKMSHNLYTKERGHHTPFLLIINTHDEENFSSKNTHIFTFGKCNKQKGGREEKRLLITQKSHALTHDQRFTTNERGHVREILKIKFLSEREEERERERVEILIKN